MNAKKKKNCKRNVFEEYVAPSHLTKTSASFAVFLHFFLPSEITTI